MSTVEIMSVNRWKRKIIVRKQPNSVREIIEALREYWHDNEVDFPLSEVARTEKPAHLFYSVHWIES